MQNSSSSLNTLQAVKAQNQRTIELLLNQLEKNDQLELELGNLRDQIKNLGGDLKSYQKENSLLRSSVQQHEQSFKTPMKQKSSSAKENELQRLDFLERQFLRLKAQNQQLKNQNDFKQAEVARMISQVKSEDHKHPVVKKDLQQPAKYSLSPPFTIANVIPTHSFTLIKLQGQQTSKEEQLKRANDDDDDDDDDDEKLLENLRMMKEEIQKLDKKDITELKALKSPPDTVKLIAQCICILFGVKPQRNKSYDGQLHFDYWDPWKKLVANASEFVKRIVDYNKGAVDVTSLKKIKKILDRPDLTLLRAKQVSRAGHALLCWVKGIYQYNEHKLTNE